MPTGTARAVSGGAPGLWGAAGRATTEDPKHRASLGETGDLMAESGYNQEEETEQSFSQATVMSPPLHTDTVVGAEAQASVSRRRGRACAGQTRLSTAGSACGSVRVGTGGGVCVGDPCHLAVLRDAVEEERLAQEPRGQRGQGAGQVPGAQTRRRAGLRAAETAPAGGGDGAPRGGRRELGHRAGRSPSVPAVDVRMGRCL